MGSYPFYTISMTRDELREQFSDTGKSKQTPKPKPTTDKNINRTLDRVVARITQRKPPR